MGVAVEPWRVWAWLWLRGCPRQGPCRGTVVVLGKDLAGGLVDALDKGFVEARRLLILI